MVLQPYNLYMVDMTLITILWGSHTDTPGIDATDQSTCGYV